MGQEPLPPWQLLARGLNILCQGRGCASRCLPTVLILLRQPTYFIDFGTSQQEYKGLKLLQRSLC